MSTVYNDSDTDEFRELDQVANKLIKMSAEQFERYQNKEITVSQLSLYRRENKRRLELLNWYQQGLGDKIMSELAEPEDQQYLNELEQ